MTVEEKEHKAKSAPKGAFSNDCDKRLQGAGTQRSVSQSRKYSKIGDRRGFC